VNKSNSYTLILNFIFIVKLLLIQNKKYSKNYINKQSNQINGILFNKTEYQLFLTLKYFYKLIYNSEYQVLYYKTFRLARTRCKLKQKKKKKMLFKNIFIHSDKPVYKILKKKKV
jgi:hypothetical protein